MQGTESSAQLESMAKAIVLKDKMIAAKIAILVAAKIKKMTK